jgi:PKHD-type hydroxylase
MTELSDDLTYLYFKDIISHADCDALCSVLSSHAIEQASVNGDDINVATLNQNIRNVSKLQLPLHTGIGAILTSVGLDANHQRWKFDITRSNQCEFLKYPVGGRYRGHIDTVLSNRTHHLTECRKLTVLAFLNDNFSGGKFFLNIDSDHLYPPQNKGTVLVFPSFLNHGVEDITQGERYSAVTWLVGPWFK